jgi:iron complex transport system substrate-binding protein
MQVVPYTVKDDLQRQVTFDFPPQRLVSLCPSLTETLFALGLDEQIVGRTSYCVHPARRVKNVRVIGGTRSVDVGRVRALKPDLVIAEKEENPRQVVEALAEALPVYVIDVTDYETALRAIRSLGALTDRAAQADMLVHDIRAAFAKLRPGAPSRVAYLVWGGPYMAAGRNTYIHALLEKCGFENVCGQLAGRYPRLTLETLRELAPHYVLLSSEPFRFDDSHLAELASQIANARVVRVDGEMFSWYGSRMLVAAGYLQGLVAELGSQ